MYKDSKFFLLWINTCLLKKIQTHYSLILFKLRNKLWRVLFWDSATNQQQNSPFFRTHERQSRVCLEFATSPWRIPLGNWPGITCLGKLAPKKITVFVQMAVKRFKKLVIGPLYHCIQTNKHSHHPHAQPEWILTEQILQLFEQNTDKINVPYLPYCFFGSWQWTKVIHWAFTCFGKNLSEFSNFTFHQHFGYELLKIRLFPIPQWWHIQPTK